jgi:hypothetical protein
MMNTRIQEPVQHAHTLQDRLAELHLYEEICEHYAQCNISPEALRDWLAERADKPAQPAPQRQPLTDAEIKNMDCRVEFDEHLRVVRMTEKHHCIGA